MRRHFLRVLECAPVGEVGADAGGAKRVAADRRGDAGRRGAAADHAPGVKLVHGELGQRIGFVAARGAEEPALTVLGDAGRIDVGTPIAYPTDESIMRVVLRALKANITFMIKGIK